MKVSLLNGKKEKEHKLLAQTVLLSIYFRQAPVTTSTFLQADFKNSFWSTARTLSPLSDCTQLREGLCRYSKAGVSNIVSSESHFYEMTMGESYPCVVALMLRSHGVWQVAGWMPF